MGILWVFSARSRNTPIKVFILGRLTFKQKSVKSNSL